MKYATYYNEMRTHVSLGGISVLGAGFGRRSLLTFFQFPFPGGRRLVRELAETSSKNANGAGGSDAEEVHQSRATLLSKGCFGGLDAGSREAVGRIASSHCNP